MGVGHGSRHRDWALTTFPSGPGSWLELEIEASPEAVDAIVEVFRSRGISGVAIEVPIEPGSDEGFAARDAPCVVKAYLPVDGSVGDRVLQLEHALWHLQAFGLSPLSELRTRIVAEEDWASAWKEHFHPARIGQRIVIKPSWRDWAPKTGDIVVELDPGMAFGTGLHPTTRMVLETMEDAVDRGARVFDIGTGSGILAVAAAKLGAGSVLAVDTDRVAIRVATENVGLNGVDGQVTVAEGSVESGVGCYDLILANIIASVISGIAEAMATRLDNRGAVIASGIIGDRLNEVERAFDQARLHIRDRRTSGDWHCLVACRIPSVWPSAS